MIKKFQNFDLSEQNISEDYVKDLLKKISKLEEYNQNLNDKIDQLEDDVRDMEKSNDDKSERIYGLEESFEKLEKENSKLEDEKQRLEKVEESLSSEKKDLEKRIEIYEEPYKVFLDQKNEHYQSDIVTLFHTYLDLMEDYPSEFGILIRKNMRPRYDRLMYAMLNKEWVDGFTGDGAGLLSRYE